MADWVPIADPDDPRLKDTPPNQPQSQPADIDLGAYLDHKTSQSALPELKPSKTTFYFPATPEETRKAGLSYRMEGGTQGGGRFADIHLPDHTVEKYDAGESKFVAIAMAGTPTGEYYRMPFPDGAVRTVRNVDTGGGLVKGQADIATSNPSLARGGGRTEYVTEEGGAANVAQTRLPPVTEEEIDAILGKKKEEEQPSKSRGGGGRKSAGFVPTPIPEYPLAQVNVPPFEAGAQGAESVQIEKTPTTGIPDFSQEVQQAVTQPAPESLVAGPPTQAAVQQADIQDIDLGAYLRERQARQATTTPSPAPTTAAPVSPVTSPRVPTAAPTTPAPPPTGISISPTPTPIPAGTPDIDLGEYLAARTSPKEIPPPQIQTPSITQHPFVKGMFRGVQKLVPPVPATPKEGLKQGVQSAFGATLPGGVISSGQQATQTIQQMADLERIKAEYGGGSPEYQTLSGELTGEILPQMLMAAGGVKGLLKARNPSEVTRMSGEAIPEPPESALAAAAATGNRFAKISKALTSLRDVFTVEPLPNLRRAGIRDSGYVHASARTAVIPVVKDFLARVFPDDYKNPKAMALTGDILVKDNVLGIYDQIQGMLKRTDLSAQLRERLQQNLQDIRSVVDIPRYDAEVRAAMANPKIAANIQRWKEQVNPEMDRMYGELRGEDPNFQPDPRGRHFGARVNLLSQAQAERLIDYADHTQPMPEPSYSNYRNPNVKRDPFARHATGTGVYVTDPEAMLLNTFTQRFVETTKLQFYKDIVASGNGVITEMGADSPPKSAGMVRMPIRMPETSPEGNVRIVERNLWVKKEIAGETRQVLNVDKLGMPHPLFQWVTTLQLMQLVDITAHMKNIHTVLANALTGSAAGTELLRRFPFISSADTVARMASVIREIQKDTPAIRAELADMAKRGEIRPKYPSTGIQKITKGQEMIHEADTAARVIMKRFWEDNVQRGRVVDMRDSRRQFVNKIGEYNQRVMNAYQRQVRALGLSPFVVAGRSFNAFSRRLIFGSPGFKPANLGQSILLRGLNVSSLAITASIVAGFNYALTGNPGGRTGTPIGAIDTGRDDSNGKPIVVDVFHVLGIRRGLRATGIGSVMEGIRRGEDTGKIATNAIGDVISSAVFPWMGPGIQAFLGATTGKRLDFRGGGDIYPVGRKLKPGEGIQYIENLRGTMKEVNPLVYSLISPLFHEAGYEEPNWQAPSPLLGSETAGLAGEGLMRGPLTALGVRSLTSRETGEKTKRAPKGFYLGR